MVVSFVIALVMSAVCRMSGFSLSWDIAIALSVPSFLGIVKEIDDSMEEGNRFDWGDIRDDLIGACAGTALGCLFWLF
jgi:uncharacterized protein YfiM (DUF2279 family)